MQGDEKMAGRGGGVRVGDYVDILCAFAHKISSTDSLLPERLTSTCFFLLSLDENPDGVSQMQFTFSVELKTH